MRHPWWVSCGRCPRRCSPELVAKRIIEAAKNGERDPIRLHWQAVMGFSIDDVSIPVDSVRRKLSVPVYAPIARLG
jgi:hypothetical protein